MEKSIKKLLYNTLQFETYLKILRFCFYLMFRFQLLRRNSSYKYHYFARHLIKKGDYVVDIGANLGYFSKIFHRLVGKSGLLVCFEPMPPFFRVLQSAFINQPNVQLYNYALGLENTFTRILHPHAKDGHFRTGLSNIPMEETDPETAMVYDIEMKKGSELLNQLPKIDYIKIDIEGYEKFVLPELSGVLQKYKPILQVETWGSQKEPVFLLLKQLGYHRYTLYKKQLIRDFDDRIEPGDYLFFHKTKEAGILAVFNKKQCALHFRLPVCRHIKVLQTANGNF